MNILVLNAGSSSLKYKLFRMEENREESLDEGLVERSSAGDTPQSAAEAIERCRPKGIDAIGHRVVHGGSKFTSPVRVTPEVLSTLKDLRGLDPLHNPTEIAVIEAGLRLVSDAPAVAVFDTSFHKTMPEVAWRYAIPAELADRLTLRRYGFHGISHQYASGRLLECLGRKAPGSLLITCHLGSGASICAIQDGKSIDTSMGLTPLEGLMMGTRSGDLDPGLLLYLLREQKMSPAELDELLNKKSGLLGLSNRSDDVRELEQAKGSDARSALALEIFAYRARKYIGAYAAALGGLDALAFTGGIGEHSKESRQRIVKGLEFLGLMLDDERNHRASGKDQERISSVSSRVEIWVIPTNEELQIAREVRAVLA